ncbi:hypothetical protein [Luteibacter jiangsuensis]|uniref:GHMP family kinase ATP-binding protein n=1 Tax=Luteibacter jiangsuensis TaxID=637577 RepID=UPI003CCE0976
MRSTIARSSTVGSSGSVAIATIWVRNELFRLRVSNLAMAKLATQLAERTTD